LSCADPLDQVLADPTLLDVAAYEALTGS